MALTLTVHDERPSGSRIRSFRLELVSERLTVGELIERRVRREVEEYNRSTPEYFHGLVQPADAEAMLNGYRLRQRRPLDAVQQTARALEAFERGGYFLLVGDRQLEHLDDEIVVTRETEVRFVKLYPLVGG
jgi:hypothetical protein